MIQWRKFELKRSYINEFMNFLIFQNFLDFILIFQDLFNRAGPAEVTWRYADTWRGHARPHGCLIGMNSDIGRSGLNRAIGRSGLNRAIGWLKSHGVESASWATIPPISRNPTVEITQSGIHIMGHDPTDFA